MAITTKVAPLFGGQKIFAALLCAVFGLWGLYDYTVKIPRQEENFGKYEKVVDRLKELKEREDKLKAQGSTLSPEEQKDAQEAIAELKDLSPGGAQPVKPSKFNRVTQWFYIACLPFAPWFYWVLLKLKRQKYTLDDEGTLHFAGNPELNAGEWKREDIADIDMSRWMAKSIAHVVHADGRRLKLDAYVYKDLHLIVGALASRFYPDKWDAEAKVIKPPEEPGSPEAGDDSGDAAMSENAAS